ncbi:MAG: agmatinase [Candidatus Methanofastidiosia archaeon]
MIEKKVEFSLHSERHPEFLLFGVPFDSTASFNPGARFGPTSVRLASQYLESFDLSSKVELSEVRLKDLGDLHISFGNPKKTTENVERFVSMLEGKVIVIGGEHSISHPITKALNPEVVLSLDAHLDLREEYLEEKLSHACVMRRISEHNEVRIYGFRECSKEEFDFLKKGKIYATSELSNSELPKNKKVYITIDMDVFDPSIAPNVSNPTPSGFNFQEVLNFVFEVAKKNEILGFDVTEVCSKNPDFTAITAASLIFKILGVLCED